MTSLKIVTLSFVLVNALQARVSRANPEAIVEAEEIAEAHADIVAMKEAAIKAATLANNLANHTEARINATIKGLGEQTYDCFASPSTVRMLVDRGLIAFIVGSILGKMWSLWRRPKHDPLAEWWSEERDFKLAV